MSRDRSQFLCYRESVKNVTVSVPDEVYRRARVRAAQKGTSVSALVAGYLRSLDDEDTEFMRLAELQRRTIDGIRAFRGGDRQGRAEVHERSVG